MGEMQISLCLWTVSYIDITGLELSPDWAREREREFGLAYAYALDITGLELNPG
jgi:hypothetical protein